MTGATASGNTAGPRINLLVVDDHAMFRDGLARVLEKEPDFKIVGESSTSAEGLAILKSSGATMVLLDVDLGSERAIDFLLGARRAGFDGQILIVTAGISDQEAVQLIQAGAAGILHKHHSGRVLCRTIRQIAGGKPFLEETYLGPLIRSVDRSRPSRPTLLTDRDKDVLRFILQGLSNREIGQQLKISEGAVKASLRHVCGKLNVRTRAQLVKVTLEQYRDEL